MKKLVLANADYQTHMTDEGNQLQLGLESAGWILSGHGYDGIVNVEDSITRYNPDVIFLQDKRDWDKHSRGCYNKKVHWFNHESLKRFNGKVISVVKDAGSCIEYQRAFIEDEIDADAVVTYYHDESVLPHCPHLNKIPRIRTYHSLDKDKVPKFHGMKDRGALVSGAINADVYPGRTKLFQNSAKYSIFKMKHPGYNNNGVQTYNYMDELSRYKVHLATSSKYKFALRKIMESVACGCVCITDLPKYDVLPGIDDALVRIEVDNGMNDNEVLDLIRDQIYTYDYAKAQHYANVCKEVYDYRVQGMLLDERIVKKCI